MEAKIKETEEISRALPPLKGESTPVAKAAAAKPANPAPAPAPAAVATPVASSTPVYEWTAEQDLMLMKMKAEEMTWRAISTGIGKPVYALKDRWALIQPKTRAPKHTSKAREEDKPASKPEGKSKTHARRVSFSEPLVTPDNNVSIS